MYFSSFFSVFLGSWKPEQTLIAKEPATPSATSTFFPSQMVGGSNFSPSGTSKIQPQDSLLIIKALYIERRRNRNFVKMEVLGFDIFSGLAVLPPFFCTPLMRKISSGSCCHGTKQDEVSTPILKLCLWSYREKLSLLTSQACLRRINTAPPLLLLQSEERLFRSFPMCQGKCELQQCWKSLRISSVLPLPR